MKQRLRLKALKPFMPSIVLTVLAMLATVFTNAHIIVPIVLIIGAVIMAYQNYNILKKASRLREQERIK